MVPPAARLLQSPLGLDVQPDHIEHQDETSSKKFIGQRWLQKVLNHLWTHLCMAGKHHNTSRYGIDLADQEAKRKAKLKPTIVALYKTAKARRY